jgi:hypothetical protein
MVDQPNEYTQSLCQDVRILCLSKLKRPKLVSPFDRQNGVWLSGFSPITRKTMQ